jgi:hypothetical protein
MAKIQGIGLLAGKLLIFVIIVPFFSSLAMCSQSSVFVVICCPAVAKR